MAITATASTAKFKIASLSCPAMWLTTPASQGGNGLDCSRLSTIIFSGQGSRRSALVSSTTASRAMVKVFQWGRRSARIFGQSACEAAFVLAVVAGAGLGVAVVSGIIYLQLR